MTRPVYIFLSAVLVAMQGAALPLHVATAHRHDLVHVNGEDIILHAHGPRNAHHHHDGDHGRHAHQDVEERSGLPEIHDGSGFGMPHRHKAQARGHAAQEVFRPRADCAPLAAAVLGREAEPEVHPLSVRCLVLAKASLPPPIYLRNAVLRGPPCA